MHNKLVESAVFLEFFGRKKKKEEPVKKDKSHQAPVRRKVYAAMQNELMRTLKSDSKLSQMSKALKKIPTSDPMIEEYFEGEEDTTSLLSGDLHSYVKSGENVRSAEVAERAHRDSHHLVKAFKSRVKVPEGFSVHVGTGGDWDSIDIDITCHLE
jgi:hypothetical protein